MHWVALPLCADEPAAPGVPAEAGAWWALRFSPRVAVIDEAVLAEVSTTARLWGGLPALLEQLRAQAPGTTAPTDLPLAQGPTALQALARLRLQQAGHPLPRRLPHDLPLRTLSAARPHAQGLEQLGCRTWGALRGLPRAGVARRFGGPLLHALDQAWGDAPHQPPWVALPETFALEAELPALAESATALLWSASALLQALQGWLQGRHQGVLALRLQWHHHLRRLDGVDLPPWDGMDLRTAEPAQEMAHLRRLLAERLGHCRLSAPVDRIALRALQTGAAPAASSSLLPPGPHEDAGEPWHQLQERWSARLGAHRVQAVQLHADHRPERMQSWQAMEGGGAGRADAASAAGTGGISFTRATDPRAALWPAWLVQPPEPLAVQRHRPCLHGPLRLLAGPERFEAAWWEAAGTSDDASVEGPARRDYFVAHGDAAGYVWVFRDLEGRWFLHGLYG